MQQCGSVRFFLMEHSSTMTLRDIRNAENPRILFLASFEEEEDFSRDNTLLAYCSHTTFGI